MRWASQIPLSKRAQFFLYHGLDRKTRATYNTYQKSYENFCYAEGEQPYPATSTKLVEWIAIRAEGSIVPGQGPLKADTITQALSAIRSVHIEQFISEEAFESPAVRRAIAGVRRVQGLKEKKKAAPLSKKQLERITSPAPVHSSNDVDHTDDDNSQDIPAINLSDNEINRLNFDTAIKLAFAGFLRTAELTYENKDLTNKAVFEHTKLQRRDITFAEDNEHAIIHLRSSKSDYEHTGVEIVVARTGEATCPVSALRALYTLDPQAPRAPLFRTSEGPFSRNHYINVLRNRLKNKGYINWRDFSGHSPRRGAAQHAADNGILEYDIQRLGRWSSQAFKGYFHISQAYKYYLNKRFQTGRSAPIIHTSLNVPN